MNDRKRMKLLLGLLAVAVIAGCIVILRSGKEPKPAPNMPGTYYTGPKKNKSGQDVYVDEDGKQYDIKPKSSDTAAKGTQNGSPTQSAETP